MYQHLRSNHFLKENLKDYVVDEAGRPLTCPNEEIKKQLSDGLIDHKLLDSTYVKRFTSFGNILTEHKIPLLKIVTCFKGCGSSPV
jgi:hypothetical protein